MSSEGYLDFNPCENGTLKEQYLSKAVNPEDLMKKTVITEEFLAAERAPPLSISTREGKRERRTKRGLTAGNQWFGMKKGQLDEKNKADLDVVRFRGALDPKRFYKSDDRLTGDGYPKYFQMGTVVESAADFYSSRLPKKWRKSTIADEVMSDPKSQAYQKRTWQTEVNSKDEQLRKAMQRKKQQTKRINSAKQKRKKR